MKKKVRESKQANPLNNHSAPSPVFQALTSKTVERSWGCSFVVASLPSSPLAEANHAAVHNHCICVVVFAFQDRRAFKLQTLFLFQKQQQKKNNAWEYDFASEISQIAVLIITPQENGCIKRYSFIIRGWGEIWTVTTVYSRTCAACFWIISCGTPDLQEAERTAPCCYLSSTIKHLKKTYAFKGAKKDPECNT